MSALLLYDEERQDLRTAVKQLKVHGLAVASDSTFSNRIEFFNSIDQRSKVCVALIDLESHEGLDNDYSGHRVIETIRRHPRLAARCHPVAYTVHAREEVIDLARRHGARAVIGKHDLDVPDDEVQRLNFGGFLAELAGTRPTPYNGDALLQDGEFAVFPDIERARERAAREQESVAPAINYVLVGRPKILRRPYFWWVVRYFADRCEPSSVARWIHADFAVSQKTVEKDIDELRTELDPRYLVRGTAWEEFARDLLARVPHKRYVATEREILRVLQRVNVLGSVLHDPKLRRSSYLDKDALKAIDRFDDPMGSTRGRGNEGDFYHTKYVLDRLVEIEPDEQARAVLQVAFVRGVSNLYDTYLAAKA